MCSRIVVIFNKYIMENGKKRIAYHSTAEDRQKSNPYYPMTYNQYCEIVLIGAYELNEMVRDVPVIMIADMWLMNSDFRGRFKRLVKAAAFIHYEKIVQSMLPWCYVDLVKYAKRFKEDGYNIAKKYSQNTIGNGDS